MTTSTDSGSLQERTLALVLKVPRNIKGQDIAAGAGVSHAWLSRFVNDKFDDPGVSKVQALHDYLVSILEA